MIRGKPIFSGNRNRLSMLLLAPALLIGCGTTLRPIDDFKWRPIYGINVPDTSRQLEIQTLANPRQPGCGGPRAPRPTQIRIVRSVAFPDYDHLPEKLQEVSPSSDALPVELTDSGPWDMTLIGSRRLFSLITGKEVLLRSKDPCTLVHLREIHASVKSEPQEATKNAH
jgi:hypothetical protein